MIKKTGKNIDKLARAVIDSWDMNTLLCYAHQNLTDYYKKDLKGFQEDWKSTLKYRG